MALTGKQVRRNVDRLVERAVRGARERGARLTNSVAFAKGIEVGARALLGWLFARAVIFGSYAPFGLGFMAVAGTGARGIAALLGLLFGAAGAGGFGWATKYVAIAILIFTAASVFRGTAVYARSWFMPACTAVMTACTGFVYLMDLGMTLPSIALYVMEVVLAAGSAYFFALSGQEKAPPERRRLSLLMLLCVSLIALEELRLFGVVSIGRSLAVLAVMAAAYRGGRGGGALAGIAFGVAMDAASGSAPFFAAAYGLCGLLSSLFSSLGRLMFVTVYVLANALTALWGWDGGLRAPMLYETFVASVLFLLLPPSALRTLREPLAQPETLEGERRSREYVRRKTEGAAHAFNEVYDVLRRAVGVKGNDNDIASVFDAASDAVCRTCRRAGQCWHRDYEQTRTALNDATGPMLARGAAEAEDFPPYFTNQCQNFPALLAAINAELHELLRRRQFRSRLAENRSALYRQFVDMSSVLSAVAEELEQRCGGAPEVERRLKLYLRGAGFDVRSGAFRDRNDRLHIELEGPGLRELRRDKQYLEKLSAAAGRRLCEPEEYASDERLLLLEAEPLSASVGIAARRKPGQSVNGDRGTYFKTDEGILCVILSDGMGSGSEAARDSGDAVRILERFLRAGIPPETALRILDTAMLLKCEEELSSATVDLMCVNLFSGETKMFKYGAAPSYVKRGKMVRRIRGESLAAGLGGGRMPACLRMELGAGSVAVITSDGVTDSRDDIWLVEMVEQMETGDMRSAARRILDRALEQCARDDDMTVLAVGVSQRK